METKDLKSHIIWKNTRKAFTDVLNTLMCGSCQSRDIQYILKCCKCFLCLICEEKIEICDKCRVEKSTIKLNDVDTTLKLCSDLSKLLRIKGDEGSAKDNSNKEKMKIDDGKILEPVKIDCITPKALLVTSKKQNAKQKLLTSIKTLNDIDVTKEKIADDIISTDVTTPSTTFSRKKEQRSIKRKLNSSFSVIDSYFSKSTSPNNEISKTKKIKIEAENICKTPMAARKSNITRLSLSAEKNTGKKLKRNNKGETTLHVACIKGDYELVRKLLEEGFNPDVKDYANWTPLHEASHHGHKNIVELLLNHSAIVDSLGCDNYTPLHDAVEQNQIECVRLLMMFGADVKKKTSQGFTALQLVQSKEMEEVLLNTTPIAVKSSLSSSLSANVDNSKLSEIQRDQLIITCSGFHSDKKSWISKVAQNLKWKFSEDFDKSVTHLIPLTNEKRLCVRTMKYMSSLILGKWIVHIDWLEACNKSKGWVDEDDYEINGCIIHPDPSILHRARTNAKLQGNDSQNNAILMQKVDATALGNKMSQLRLTELPKLFEGGNFYLSPKLPLPVKNDLTLLIKYGSGQISNRGIKLKLDELDDEDIDPLNQSILNQSFNSTTSTTTLYNADASSAFSCCSYIVVVPTLDDLNGNTVNDKSSKKSKNCKDKTESNAKKSVLYRIINKKVCHVTPAWIFECVSKLCIA